MSRLLALDPVVLATVAVVVLLLGTWMTWWVIERPQRGLLLLAALLPFDGLLLIVPGGGVLAPWSDGAVLAILGASLVAPAAARRQGGRLPGWWPAVAAYVGFGAASAIAVGGTIGLWGFKVTYFAMLLPLILWRCPFTARDRDVLVTILMTTGVVTSAYGLLQQVLGHERLAELGYEYNTAIRFSGDLLRSFSSFVQPFPFGMFVSMVLLVCLPIAMADPRRFRNGFFLAMTPVLVAGMAASVVRGAILQLAAGLLLLTIWRFRGLIHAAGPAVITAILLPTTAVTAFLSSDSLGVRASGWNEIIARILSAPLGNGLGVTGAAAERSYTLGVPLTELVTEPSGGLYLPDNYYVLTLIHLGVVGLWLLLLLVAGLLVTGTRLARTCEGEDRYLAMGIVASIVGAATTALVSTYLEIFPLNFYFWLLAGVLTCMTPSTSTPSHCAPEAVESPPTSASSSTR